MLREKNTTRDDVRDWIEEAIEGKDGVDLAALTNKATEHFLHDEDFVRREIGEILRPVVYEIAQKVLADTRGDVVVNLGPDEIVTRREHKRRSNRLAERFARWMEHAGDEGHIRLVKMQKHHLLAAAQERKKRGATELKIAAFEERLAAGLKSDTELVEERYTAADLEGIWTQVEEDTNGSI